MEIEVLDKNHKKKIITIITFIVLALVVIIFSVSLAKYRSTKSISIAKGTVNYKQGDLNLVSVYLEDEDNNYKPVSNGKIPTSGYTLNEDITKTRCEIKGVADTNIKITYENGEVSFSKLTTTGTKCYLYFNKIKDTEAPVIGVHEARNIEKTSMDLYVEATDNTGIAGYYFKLNTSSDWGTAKCAGQNSCTHSLTGLTKDTTYTYDVKVCDAGGNCPATQITQKTKEDGIPSGTTSKTLIAGGISSNDYIFANPTNGNGIYIWTKGDYSGGSETIKYYRGNVNNNWVVFGKDGDNYIWWRIIRNNSNGSLRMMYSGVSESKSHASTNQAQMIISKSAFNPDGKNYYAGLEYATNSMHGTSTNAQVLGTSNSTDRTTLYGWYNETLGKNVAYSNLIDKNAGFCSDRNHATTGNGTPTANAVSAGENTAIFYATDIRTYEDKVPSLLCANSSDKFTDIPVGMITGDEVLMGGMGYGTAGKNTNSWLYLEKALYWTMSPSGMTVREYSGTLECYVSELSVYEYLRSTSFSFELGVRPVINLKSSATFEEGGAGTSTNPYVVCD